MTLNITVYVAGHTLILDQLVAKAPDDSAQCGSAQCIVSRLHDFTTSRLHDFTKMMLAQWNNLGEALSEQQRELFGDAVVDTLCDYCPNIKDITCGPGRMAAKEILGKDFPF
jgi:hypothetical protein